MKHLANMGLLWSCLFCTSISTQTTAQCTLACNDLVQVSIPDDGFAVVLPDMILEGDDTDCPGPKLVEITNPLGEGLGDTVFCDWVGDVLNVMVFDVQSGNFCWGTILVEDKLKPVIACQDTTLNCTADLHPDSIGLVSVTDNCDADPTLSFTENIAPQACTTSLTQIVTRTWHATDENGNQAFPCTQKIFVTRPALADVVFPPHFDNNQAPALPCENADTSTSNTGFPMVDGLPVGLFCKINVFYEDLVVGSSCDAGFGLLREWTVLDCCSGEMISHVQNILVEDIEGPVLDCPAPLTRSANGPDCDGYFFLPTIGATDACSMPITFHTLIPGEWDNDANGGFVNGLPLGTYTAVYTATDACGNQSTCTVPLAVVDNVPPAAICDETTVVSLGSNGFANVPAAVFDDGSHDACCAVSFLVKRMDGPAAPFSQNALFDCADAGDTVTVILQVSDCLGNANTCMVQVLVEDKLPPVITCPADVTIECAAWPAPPVVTGQPTAQDNCGLDTLFYQDFENLNLCNVGTITRTFTAIDSSGFAVSCSQTITTIDTTGVQFFFPADTVTDCSIPLDSISAGQAKAIADCELFGLATDDEIFPIECGFKIFRTYTFLEWCSGVDTSYTQFIEVHDTNPPEWDLPPGSKDTMYVCPGDLVKPPPPTATDYCTPATVTLMSDNTVYMGCDNRYVRTLTYSAADTCGNVADPFIITLTVHDTLAPSPHLADKGPYNCFEDLPPFIEADVPAVDNCPGDVTVEFLSQSLDPGTCAGFVTRTYRLTDMCGLDTIATQKFLFNDTIPPAPIDSVIGPFTCVSQIPEPLGFEAVDNCGGPVTAEFLDETGNMVGCAGEIRRFWRLTDDCGNDTIVIQRVLINDNVPPVLGCPADLNWTIVQDMTCTVDIELMASAVDNCGGPVTLSNSITGMGGTFEATFELGTTNVTFFAADACGNVTSCAMEVTIDEIRRPENFCTDFDVHMQPGGVTILNVDSLLAVGEFGGADFCTPVTFEFSPTSVTCDDFLGEGTPIFYTLIVTDTFGNSSMCNNDFFLFDPDNACGGGLNVPVVAGRVNLHTGAAMAGVEMHLSDASGTVLAQTDEHGLFIFENMPPNSSCTLQPFKDDDLLNGVTTFDLLLITKHVLGQQPITSPWSLLAADVNNSGAVTTADVLALRKAVLYIHDFFPNNTSWRFVDASYTFPDPLNPFAEELSESIWLPNITGDEVSRNFTALKVGDVNGSASPNFGGSTDDRAGEGFISLSANEVSFAKGQTVQVPIFANGEKTLAAMQATLQFDFEKMAFRGIGPGLLNVTDEHFALPAPGFATLSWDDLAGQPTHPDDILFYLHFETLASGQLGHTLFLNSMKTPAIAFEDGGDPLNIRWHIHEAPTVPVDGAALFELAQNAPNPFAERTTLRFHLAEPMPVRLEVVDLTGRRLAVLDGERSAGWHEVELEHGFFGGSGVYLCHLVTPHGTVVLRMMAL